VTPAKCSLFDKLFQYHQQNVLEEVRSKVTGPRSRFPPMLAQTVTDAEKVVYWVVNTSANNNGDHQVLLSKGATEAATCRMPDSDPLCESAGECDL